MKNLIHRITNPKNPRIKEVVKLRKRSYRDEKKCVIIEGFRELKRAVANKVPIQTVFYCTDLFLGTNEGTLLNDCATTGTERVECDETSFRKISYRDRPDGLLALAPQIRHHLDDLRLPQKPLLLIAERIEKPGNLGTMLRTADAAGVDAVIVCDRCTDIHNPNVVRSSIGALFTLPVVEATSREALSWLQEHGIRVVTTSPDAERNHTDVDLTGPTAVVVGAEQYGVSRLWLEQADTQVRIPMLGQCDSLNVSSATAILLFEAVRQRGKKP